jgi:hypothetical protein
MAVERPKREPGSRPPSRPESAATRREDGTPHRIAERRRAPGRVAAAVVVFSGR